MPGGRPPKPTRLKSLAGNPGKRRLNKREPRPPAAVPRCPAWLPKTAKTEWRRVVGILQPLGLLTHADLAPLVAYCTAWAELQEATKLLHKEGRVCSTQSGYQVPHPAVAMQRSAWAAVRQLSALFGFDPSSRARLQMPEPEKEDPFEAFLKHAAASKN
jgi:P27 family predicted phage terminase small subunit